MAKNGLVLLSKKNFPAPVSDSGISRRQKRRANFQWRSVAIATIVILTSNPFFTYLDGAASATIKSEMADTDLSVGDNHACEISESRAVKCWGDNTYGQSTPPNDLGAATQISAGKNHTCVVTLENTARCWGDNSSGQSTPPNDLGTILEISSGAEHTCVVTTENFARCWGGNSSGQSTPPNDLGQIVHINAKGSRTCAVTVSNLTPCWGYRVQGSMYPPPSSFGQVLQVDYFDEYCALYSSGKVWCGMTRTANSGYVAAADVAGITHEGCILYRNGEVDSGSYITNLCIGITKLTGLGKLTKISSSDSAICARLLSGKIRCWGSVDYSLDFPPVRVNTLDGLTQISVGAAHACAITKNKSVSCWGANSRNQNAVPNSMGKVKLLSSGNEHTCAVDENYTAKCWGGNFWSTSTVPSDLGKVKDLSAGGDVTCAIDASNKARCWGYDRYGVVSPPVTLGDVVKISMGEQHGCAISAARLPVCWGYNFYGQTTPPSTLKDLKDLSSGGGHTCAVTTSGLVTCWGDNRYGQSTPPPGLSSVKQIASGGSHTCALTFDSIVTCWGRNSSGESTPPADLGPVRQISAGGALTCAITKESKIVCWGSGEYSRKNLSSQSSIYPPNIPEIDLENLGNGLHISVRNLARNTVGITPEDGSKTWTAWDVSTNQILCKNVSDDTCKSSTNSIGKTYKVKVVVKNEAGTSLGFISSGYKNCAPTPSLSSFSSKNSPISSTQVVISGSLRNFCTPFPQSISYRERKKDKNWGSWSSYRLPSNLKVSLTKYFAVPTEVQFKASTSSGEVVTSEPRLVAVKPGIRYNISTVRTYTNKSFAQGGIITFSVSAGRGYKGECVLLGDTDYAFNFALTSMSAEHKYGSISVRNGFGKGKLEMRWNGIVATTIFCQSTDFPDDDYMSHSKVALKANF